MNKCLKWGVLFFLGLAHISFATEGEHSMALQSSPTKQKMDNLSFFGEQTGNPSVYPQVKRWIDPYITAEFTYWQIQPGGVGYFRNGQRKQPNSTLSQGKITQLDPKWEPGFKVALGGVFPHDNWDLSARYTYVNTTVNGSASDFVQAGQESFNVNVNNGRSVDLTSPVSAKGYFHARLNAMDLELGRKFFNSRFLALKLFSGLKGTWISAKDRYSYGIDRNVSNSNLTIDGNDATGPVVVKDDSFTWGIGPRLGLEANWYFIQSISIFTRLSLGPIFSNVDAHSRVEFFNEGSPPLTAIDIKNSQDFITNLNEIQLGLEGEWWLYDKTYKITARILYEVQTWDGAYGTVNSTEINEKYINMHGVTGSLGFLF